MLDINEKLRQSLLGDSVPFRKSELPEARDFLDTMIKEKFDIIDPTSIAAATDSLKDNEISQVISKLYQRQQEERARRG